MLQHPLRDSARPLTGGRRKSAEADLDIVSLEPALFIPPCANKPAVFRGSCIVNVHEKLPVKRLTVNLRGVSHVKWSYGRNEMRTFTDCKMVLLGPETKMQDNACGIESSDCDLNGCHAGQEHGRLWNPFQKKFHPSGARKMGSKHQVLSPGIHEYGFEMVLPPQLPESICVRGSNVQYNVEACIERPGRLSHPITQNMPIVAVHCPEDDFLEDAEPVYISRNWRHLLHCEVTLSRRGAALGDQLPVVVSLEELGNAKLQGLKIFLSENTQYLQRNGLQSCLGPFKRVLLHDATSDSLSTSSPQPEAQDDSTGSSDDSTSSEEDWSSDATEKPGVADERKLEINLSLPKAIALTHAESDGKLNMHFDTKYQNVQVSHWLEFEFTLSRHGSTGSSDVLKTARAPFVLRSCYAHPANASLPSYDSESDGPTYMTVSAAELGAV
ncbi:arrestin domain-containing protein [Aspergillus steynii IBT 23096]|uniref:Arrestin domain-containing protein n=1 Tax=Aspergillus steynii IBT 23096 TaxID=1392250 RepID=A0A2I2G803_9EURO|nr:arrestin domain-containing protein [Aspergillus steynii IBT 23096]PLB49017.1 arrestin domain-containing protein [Aspergillus steynii IBT 23096]